MSAVTSTYPVFRVCDGCDVEVFASAQEMRKRGWRQYSGKDWVLLLCPQCKPAGMPSKKTRAKA